MSVIRSYTDSIGDELSKYKTLMVMGVRLASWNQILDPWVYILLRRTVLRKIYLIAKCQKDLKGSVLRRWDHTSFHSSEKNAVHHIWSERKTEMICWGCSCHQIKCRTQGANPWTGKVRKQVKITNSHSWRLWEQLRYSHTLIKFHGFSRLCYTASKLTYNLILWSYKKVVFMQFILSSVYFQ